MGGLIFQVAAALVGSAMNGEVLTEWVAPALLKAYQSQVISNFNPSF